MAHRHENLTISCVKKKGKTPHHVNRVIGWNTSKFLKSADMGDPRVVMGSLGSVKKDHGCARDRGLLKEFVMNHVEE